MLFNEKAFIFIHNVNDSNMGVFIVFCFYIFDSNIYKF